MAGGEPQDEKRNQDKRSSSNHMDHQGSGFLSSASVSINGLKHGSSSTYDEPPSPPKAGNSSSETSGGRTISHKPCLDEARKFGEKRKPYRIPDPSQSSGYRLARIGELQDEATGSSAEKYHIFKTSFSGLDEFGIGISLYFRQLYCLSVIFFLCGLVSIPAIWYNSRFNPPGTSFLARGSVVGAERSDLSFAYTSMVDFTVVLVLVLFALLSRKVSMIIAAKIDESQQTAQDYSVCIKNPPHNFRDTDVYFERFSKYGDVVTITLALDNGHLLACIARKKEVERKLNESVEGARLLEAEKFEFERYADSSPLWKRIFFAFGLYEDTPLLWAERRRLKAQIAVAAKPEPRVRRVYITFNTEDAQRACLQDFYCGWGQRLSGGRVLKSTKPEAVFQGRVLSLEEPVEPSEVIWENLRYRIWHRTLRFFISAVLSGVLLIASYLTLERLSANGKKGGIISALMISLVNILLPLVIKNLTMFFELPLTVSGQQQSILIKLVLARCMNTAVIMYLVTNYTETFSALTMSNVMTILIADAVVAPLIQVLNIPQRLMQRFLAPQAETQRQMNQYYQGIEWHLSERYTEVSKTMFVSVFWSAILPQGLFVTAIALMVNYWSDKYALFNIWKRPPALNARLVTLSREFLTLTILCHVWMARVFFANWPYGNDKEKTRCNLFFCHNSRFMSTEQKVSVHFYSVLSVIIFVLIFQTYFWGPIGTFVNSFRRRYFIAGQGHAVDIEYRRVFGIAAYVPLIHTYDTGHLNENWLAADVKGVPRELIPIQPGLDVEEHNLCSQRELPALSEDEASRRFSVIRFFAAPRPRAAASQQEQQSATFAKYKKKRAHSGPLSSALAGVMNKLLLPSHISNRPLSCCDRGGGSASVTVPKTEDVESAETKAEAPLPAGWEKGLASDGSDAFIDMDTLDPQQERPVKPSKWNLFNF